MHYPQFDDIGAGRCDEPAVRIAAAGGELGVIAGDLADGPWHDFAELPGRCQEGLARQVPVQFVIDVDAISEN